MVPATAIAHIWAIRYEAYLLCRRIDKIQLNAKNVFYSEFNIDIESFPDKIEMDYYNEGIH